ncbi:hypothetical protein MA16_Dca023459 [Dendrobium catenatum]|uniref:Uncharacterized protein n=1 Tax=Dendrobium catenatum TaxID=906689 RepID=A0A2I0V870_9ASPA|nr:hypothetical protein MA16_Dca023459 [Dendrobium catenatum]
MDDFNNMISNCNLFDIGFSGCAFTWNRGSMWQRIDRLLFNNDWIKEFTMTQVHHLSRTLSDHAPLLMNISNNKISGSLSFTFQNMWIAHSSFFSVISTNCNAGPDGFTTKFFIKTWDIIKFDVVDAVRDFFNGNSYPKFFSSTNIVLIPKKETTKFWNDFRPISLCTFFNKLVAKIISSRLMIYLPRIISSNHTGFVKGRSIFDNILLISSRDGS